jgi:hypothetical protein
MIQDQLVEYISSQFKLGISRDTIKSALTGVGWAPLDVEDTLKKVEGGAVSASAQPTIAPQKTTEATSGTGASPKFVSFSAPGTVTGQGKNPEPQTIRVSDLVSSVAPSSATSAGAAPKIISSSGAAGIGKSAPITKDPMQKSPLVGTFSASVMPERKKRGMGLLGILAIVLIVLLGALAGYLFFENSGLNSQIRAQGGANQNVAQSSATQVQAINASNTALQAQVTSLTAENQDLITNLSFFVASSSLPATSTPVSVSGMLAAGLGKNTFIITTTYGAKAYVKNSSNTTVAALLQPLLGATVQISGTYVPGTPNITVTSINGSPVFSPSAAAPTATAPIVTPPVPALPPAPAPIPATTVTTTTTTTTTPATP